MPIQSIASTILSSLSVTAPQRKAETAQSAKIAESADISGYKSATNVLAKYDLKNISWNEIQKMGQELYDQGIISDKQLLDITTPYFIQPEINRIRPTITADSKIDYLSNIDALYNDIKKNQASDPASIERIEKVKHYFDNFAAAAQARST